MTSNILVAGKYRLGRKLGGGSFGEIHLGTNLQTGEEVGVKLVRGASGAGAAARVLQQMVLTLSWPLLLCRSPSRHATRSCYTSPNCTRSFRVEVCLQAQQAPRAAPADHPPVTLTPAPRSLAAAGIPNLRWYGIEGEYNVMVIDLLGPSLEDLFNFCSRRFTVKTVLMLADNMVRRRPLGRLGRSSQPCQQQASDSVVGADLQEEERLPGSSSAASYRRSSHGHSRAAGCAHPPQ